MRHLVATALAAATLMLPACGKDSTGPGKVVLAFVGTVNGDNGSMSGSIVLTINGSSVTGTLKIVAPSSATVALSGTYDAGSKSLAATGGGFSFAGIFDGSQQLAGTVSGTTAGTFVASKDDSNSALAYCGTFAGDDAGVFNFTIVGSGLSGNATTTSGTSIPLNGTITGSSLTIANPGGGAALATGTRSGDNVSGSWDNGAGSTGTWTGARCN